MDKILLVTGASSDVGINLMSRVYRDYKRIYLQYRNMNEELRRLIDEIQREVDVVALQVDFTDIDKVKAMIATIKESGLIPNCVVHLPAPKAYNMQFHKDSWENFELGITISVRSIVLILQEFIKNMSKEGYGRIVFMLTSCTLQMPPKYQASYVTSKYALLGLMNSLAVEYADKGITVNAISPDMMETKFLSNLPELIVEKNKENSPIGRNVKIDEIIPIVEYMLSDLGAAMTGQNIGVTGGL